VLRRRRALIIVTLLAALFAAYLITPRKAPYVAQASLYVGAQNVNINPGVNDVTGDRQVGLNYLANSYAHLIVTRTVAEKALASSAVPRTYDDVKNEIAASTELQTQIITVTVSDTDPTVAERLANAVADNFVELINAQERLQNPTVNPAANAAPAPVSVFEHAVLPTTPQSTGLFRNLLLGLLFGLVVAVGIVILLEYLDLTIKSADDARHRLQLPVLGALPDEPAAVHA